MWQIPVELFKTLKDDAIKVLHSICQQIWKTQQWPWDWKRSFLIPIPKKGSTKECANHQTTVFISRPVKGDAQSCPILWDPMDPGPPDSSVNGILQPRTPEWVAIPFSRASSQPRDWTRVFHITGRFFTVWATREALHASKVMLKILYARLKHYANQELPDVQAGFRKGRGTRDQTAKVIPEKRLPLFHWLCRSLWLCGS